MKNFAAAEITVSGAVQGVGFRYFTEESAAALGLDGYVMNLPDGRSVKVVASGKKEDVEKLIAELRKGPPSGRVLSLEVEWKTGPVSAGGFSIKY